MCWDLPAVKIPIWDSGEKLWILLLLATAVYLQGSLSCDLLHWLSGQGEYFAKKKRCPLGPALPPKIYFSYLVILDY